MNPLFLFRKEMTPVRKLLLMHLAAGGKLVQDYVSNNPAVFVTDVAKPLVSLFATWTPTQSGTGDPSPENVRPISGLTGLTVWHAGKNLLDVSQFKSDKVWWDGTLVNGYTNYYASNKISVVPNTKYTLKKSVTGQNQLQFFDADGTYLRQNTGTLGYTVSTFTIPSDAYFIALNLEQGAIGTAQLEVGETASEYVPFSGESFPVVFPALGKNLLNPANRIASGNNVQYYRTENKLLLKGGQTYTLSANVTPSQLSLFDKNNASIKSTTLPSLTYTPTEDISVWIDIYVANSRLPEGGISAVYGQLENGGSASSFEPYTNTVYGGSLDLVTGVLTTEWKNIASYNGETLPGEWMSDRNVYSAGSTPTTGAQVVYKLATSDTYQLTPQEITAMIGTNTVWSDANGNCYVEYLKKG